MKDLYKEIIWRGFAIKKGLPSAARKFYEDLSTKLIKHLEWTEYVSKKEVDPIYYKYEQFFKIVMDDKADIRHWPKNAWILK